MFAEHVRQRRKHHNTIRGLSNRSEPAQIMWRLSALAVSAQRRFQLCGLFVVVLALRHVHY